MMYKYSFCGGGSSSEASAASSRDYDSTIIIFVVVERSVLRLPPFNERSIQTCVPQHRPYKMLSWLASTAAKQAALMALLASLPGMWWTYSGLTEADLEDPAKFATAHVLLSLGLALLVAGLAYKVRRSEGVWEGLYPLLRLTGERERASERMEERSHPRLKTSVTPSFSVPRS